MSLKKFIEQQNRIIAMWGRDGEKPFDIKNLTAQNKKDLASSLMTALSPEWFNLRWRDSRCQATS